MKQEPIIIDETGVVEIHPTEGTVWMTQNEIARTFGVYVSTVGANARSILKNRILREEETVRHTHHKDGSVTTHYNLDMITALAYRFDSWQADRYRRWLIRGAVNPAVLWKMPRRDSMAN